MPRIVPAAGIPAAPACADAAIHALEDARTPRPHALSRRSGLNTTPFDCRSIDGTRMTTAATTAAPAPATPAPRMPAGAVARPSSAEAGRGASTTGGRPETAAPRAAGAAAVVDLSAAAQRQIAQRGTGAAGRVRSLDEIVQARTKALAGTLTERLTRLGVPQDEPIVLRLDDLGLVKTDSPYREGIETLFRETPELRQAFQDVAARNVMKAAQTALEAFAAETKAARDDAARSAAFRALHNPADDVAGVGGDDDAE
jgi:hypothetical protein